MKKASSSPSATAISKFPVSSFPIQETHPTTSLSASPSSSAHPPKSFPASTAKASFVRRPFYRRQSQIARLTYSPKFCTYYKATHFTSGTTSTEQNFCGTAGISTSKDSSRNSFGIPSLSTWHESDRRSS